MAKSGTNWSGTRWMFGAGDPWSGPRERRGLLSENYGTAKSRRDAIKTRAKKAQQDKISRAKAKKAQADKRQAERDRAEARRRGRDSKKGQGWLW